MGKALDTGVVFRQNDDVSTLLRRLLASFYK